VMGGANMVMHGAGWMEGGLVASFEKLIVDAEMLQMMREFLQPFDMADLDKAMTAIGEVGPGVATPGIGTVSIAVTAPLCRSRRSAEMLLLSALPT
jgi:trimethylamine:corrinoid methyltransferase-like protein